MAKKIIETLIDIFIIVVCALFIASAATFLWAVSNDKFSCGELNCPSIPSCPDCTLACPALPKCPDLNVSDFNISCPAMNCSEVNYNLTCPTCPDCICDCPPPDITVVVQTNLTGD